MRINELLAEQQSLDEISLTGIGKGIGKVAGAMGKTSGNIQGAWRGAKDAYSQARDRTANIAQRNVSRAGGFDKNKAQARTTRVPGSTPTGSTPTNDIPTTTNTAPRSIAKNSSDIVGRLKDVWDDATAHQGSMTSSPQVQQQIIDMAKHAGLTGRTIESVGYSRFLGMDL